MRLKYVCRLAYGDALRPEQDATGSIEVFGSNGQYTFTDRANTLGPAIIVGRKGSYGKVNWSPHPCFASDTTFFIDLTQTSHDLRWLFWTLQTIGIDEGSHEAAIPGVNRETIYEKRVFVPPIAMQRRIANFLDAETAQIDALLAEKERMLALLEEKRAAMVSRAVTRGLNPNVPMKLSSLDWLGDIPTHWEVLQLKRTWSSAEYGISEDIRGEGSVKVLRMSCIVDGRIDLTNAGEIEQVPPHLLVHEGDILFNRTNSLDQVAKVGLLDQEPEMPTSFASYLVRIRVNDMVSKHYLVALLNSCEFLNYARSNAIPAIGQANLNPARYGNIQIPLPLLDEQNAIVAVLAQERTRTAELEASLHRSIALLKERRSALITAAVTGRIKLETIRT